MGGATSVMPVIRDAFSQWTDTIRWTVRCDWLQVTNVVTFNFYLASFIAVVMAFLFKERSQVKLDLVCRKQAVSNSRPACRKAFLKFVVLLVFTCVSRFML